jgi:hypothetical protein
MANEPLFLVGESIVSIASGETIAPRFSYGESVILHYWEADAGGETIEGSISFGASASVAHSAAITGSAALSLGAEVGMSNIANLNIFNSVSLDASAGILSTSRSDVLGSLGLDAGAGISASANANMFGLISLAASASIVPTWVFVVESSLSLGTAVGLTPSGDVTEYVPTGDSPIGNLLLAIQAKLATGSYVTNPNNIKMGESPSILDLVTSDGSNFPRFELLIEKDKSNGYLSQRQKEFSFRLSLAGYMQRDSDEVSFSDMVNLTNFGVETRSLIFSFLDDKQAGNSPCTGFSRMGEFDECFYEFEIFPKISAFAFPFEIILILTDTQKS